MLTALQQVESATYSIWCAHVLKDGLDPIPYTNKHKRAVMFAANRVIHHVEATKQRAAPALDFYHRISRQHSMCSNLGLFLLFIMGYTVHQLQTNLLAGRWMATGRDFGFLLLTSFTILILAG